MGKLKEYYFNEINQPMEDDNILDQEYEKFLELEKCKLKVVNLLFKDYITAEEFDLMFNDEIEIVYGK